MRLAPRRTLLAAAAAAAALSGAAWAQPAPPAAPGEAGAVVRPAQAPAARAAVLEFEVEGGEASPALGMQLQEGFLVGFLRAGLHVLDSVDVGRRLDGIPELQKCDNSLCLKRLGQVLEVRHVLRVRVNVTGNSYRMSARLFQTDGSAPAVLPVVTKSRACDVCTVAEAREVMIRLADDVRAPLEDPVVVETPPPPPPPPPARAVKPAAGLAAGLMTLVAGAVVVLAASDGSGKALPAAGGALVGAGLVVGGASTYLLLDERRPARPARPAPAAALGMRFRF